MKGYAGIIIKRTDGKMLFQLRDNKPSIPNPNKWGIIGGGIEKGESAIRAVTRELNEELGLKIAPQKITPLITIPTLRGPYHIFQLNYLSHKTSLRLYEGQKIKFLSRKQILKKANVVSSLRLFLILYPIIEWLR